MCTRLVKATSSSAGLGVVQMVNTSAHVAANVSASLEGVPLDMPSTPGPASASVC